MLQRPRRHLISPRTWRWNPWLRSDSMSQHAFFLCVTVSGIVSVVRHTIHLDISISGTKEKDFIFCSRFFEKKKKKIHTNPNVSSLFWTVLQHPRNIVYFQIWNIIKWHELPPPLMPSPGPIPSLQTSLKTNINFHLISVITFFICHCVPTNFQSEILICDVSFFKQNNAIRHVLIIAACTQPSLCNNDISHIWRRRHFFLAARSTIFGGCSCAVRRLNLVRYSTSVRVLMPKNR